MLSYEKKNNNIKIHVFGTQMIFHLNSHCINLKLLFILVFFSRINHFLLAIKNTMMKCVTPSINGTKHHYRLVRAVNLIFYTPQYNWKKLLILIQYRISSHFQFSEEFHRPIYFRTCMYITTAYTKTINFMYSDWW